MRRSLFRDYGLASRQGGAAAALPPTSMPSVTRVLLEGGAPFDFVSHDAPAVYAPPARR